MKLILRKEAETDIETAFDWYETRQPGLGAQFIEALDQLFQIISDNPEGFPCILGQVRRGLTRRFPYAVYFQVNPDYVDVIGILHQRRNPAAWHKRQ